MLDFYELVVEELFFCLGEIVFGTNMVGAKAYYLLRRLIWDYKVNPGRGIKEWHDRFKVLQTYIPYVPRKALDKRGAVKQTFTEQEKRDLINNSLPRNYHYELISEQWNIYTFTNDGR